MKDDRPNPEETRSRYENWVFPTEREYIKNRRAVAQSRTGEREVKDDLAGLALSGGGIRSATFGLGVLQALHRFQVFRHIDYISTVSGGGFIGSSLSALLANAFYKRRETSPGSFPFGRAPGDKEREEVTHLRNNSNYMAPRGVWDLLRSFAVLLRGIILNSLCLFPFLLLVCLAVLLIYGQQLSDRARLDDQVERIDGLLARYYGDRMDADRKVEPLLEVLDAEALLRPDQGKARNDLLHNLRTLVSFEPGERRGLLRTRAVVGDDLITGNGTAAAPFQFRPGATRKDFARALLGADVLQRFEVIQETELLVREIEKAPFRPCPECAEKLIEILQRRSLLRDGLEKSELLDLLAVRGFAVATGDNPKTYRLLPSATLKSIVQALYNGEYLNEDTVREKATFEWPGRETFYSYGWYAGRVGQPFPNSWYNNHPYPKDHVEEEISQLAEAVSEADTKGDFTRKDDQRDAVSLRLDRANELIEYLLRAQLLRKGTTSGNVRDLLRFKGLLDNTEPPCFRFEFAPKDVLRELYFGSYLDEQAVECILRAECFACSRVYSVNWHRTLVGRTYPGDWCSSRTDEQRAQEPGCRAMADEAWLEIYRALEDPSTWNPERIRLPFTWIIVRLALGWVLLFPFIHLEARWFYRRRRRTAGREPNPLVALLTSDESLVWRERYDQSFGWLLVLILGSALVELLPYAVHHFHYLSARGQSFQALAAGAVSLVIAVLSGPALAFLKRFGRKVALVLLAVAGPLLLLTVFVFIMEYAVYPGPGTSVGAPPALSSNGLDRSSGDDEAGLWIRVASFFPTKPDSNLLWYDDGGRRFLNMRNAVILFLLLAVASVVLALLVDINATSIHGMYRDRLAQAFLVGLDTHGDLAPEEDLALHQICPDGSGAPYHLINVTLNLQGSGDPSLRGRQSAAMCLSRDFIGGPWTDFCRTRDMEWLHPQLHLASAMAVSGAAVSPNMGRFTSGALVVLMSLLNTRLALWIPNPRRVLSWFAWRMEGVRPKGAVPLLKHAWRRFRMRAPATLLLRELFSAIDDSGPLVNVSDGGHLENTGALELLRRRCRYILIVDGESDPSMSFEGLARLMRLARIDMGIEIDLNLDDLRHDETGLTRRHAVAGSIKYPECGEDPAATGCLIYVKLSMTGRERVTAAEYRARNPDFPHQSTGDQSFDEDQFEAYRELGYHAGKELFDTLGTAEREKLSNFESFHAWFRGVCET